MNLSCMKLLVIIRFLMKAEKMFLISVIVYCCFCIYLGFYGTNCTTVDDLVKQWSPLIWLSPNEQYMPSNVEEFLPNIYVTNEEGRKISPHLNQNVSKYRTKELYLSTYRSIDKLKNNTNSFIYGRNPNQHSVSIYALVTNCKPNIDNNQLYKNSANLYFHISYWIFYPYNEGKELCVLGRVPALKFFNRCVGRLRTLGNHVGDWEHMSLSFAGKTVPESLYLAVHDTGAYYNYNEENRYFKFGYKNNEKVIPKVPQFPDILRTQGEHPVIFSSEGSHGMWAAPGEHVYLKLPKLTDKTGFGTPWKTWNNIKIYHLGQDALPYWMNFRGKWGNPKTNCLLSKKLGICEYSDGPDGVIRSKQDFYCSSNG